jgi:hypothetical protein
MALFFGPEKLFQVPRMSDTVMSDECNLTPLDINDRVQDESTQILPTSITNDDLNGFTHGPDC